MILTETKLEMLVCSQLLIDRQKPYQFFAKFGLIWANFTWTEFLGHNFYLLWYGWIEQEGKSFCFVSHIDSEMVMLLPKGIFDYNRTENVLRIYAGEHYYAIIGTDGRQRLIPHRFFNRDSVRQGQYFVGMDIPQKGNLIIAQSGEKKFLAWIFYREDKICNVFNIEDGVWIEPEAVSDQKFVNQEGFYLGNCKFECYEKVIEKAKKRNFYK